MSERVFVAGWETRSLPMNREGFSYITAELAVQQPHIHDMIRRQAGWVQHLNADMWTCAVPGEIPVRVCLYGEIVD
jgi:hypothetical protein